LRRGERARALTGRCLPPPKIKMLAVDLDFTIAKGQVNALPERVVARSNGDVELLGRRK